MTVKAETEKKRKKKISISERRLCEIKQLKSKSKWYIFNSDELICEQGVSMPAKAAL